MLAPEVEALLKRYRAEGKRAKSRTNPIKDALPKRIRTLRLKQGITTHQLATTAGVSFSAANNWQLGATRPYIESVPALAKGLGVPIAQLFTDDPVIAEVTLSSETLARIKREGRPAAAETAQRLALMLEPLIWQEATRKPVDVSPGARAKPRRNRAQVLAQGPKRHARKTIE